MCCAWEGGACPSRHALRALSREGAGRLRAVAGVSLGPFSLQSCRGASCPHTIAARCPIAHHAPPMGPGAVIARCATTLPCGAYTPSPHPPLCSLPARDKGGIPGRSLGGRFECRDRPLRRRRSQDGRPPAATPSTGGRVTIALPRAPAARCAPSLVLGAREERPVNCPVHRCRGERARPAALRAPSAAGMASAGAHGPCSAHGRPRR